MELILDYHTSYPIKVASKKTTDPTISFLNHDHPHYQLLKDIDEYGFQQTVFYCNHKLRFNRQKTYWQAEFSLKIKNPALISNLNTVFQFGNYLCVCQSKSNQIFDLRFRANYRQDYVPVGLSEPLNPEGLIYRTFPMVLEQVKKAIDYLIDPNDNKLINDRHFC